MRDECALVDAISATATIQLDLNSAAAGGWYLNGPPQFPPPPLDLAIARTLMRDGARVPAGAFNNRTIVLPLRCNATGVANDEAVKAQRLGGLETRLNLPLSILRFRPAGATGYTFYRVLRSPSASLDHWTPADGVLDVTATLLAEPFGLGLPVTAGATTGPDNANPYFETNVTNWTGQNGATVTRTTAQFHEGGAAMRLTPDGVTAAPRSVSEPLTAAPGRYYHAEGWLRSPGATPTVGTTLRWYSDAGGTAFIASSGTLSAIVASTWTQYTVEGVAPSNAASYRIGVEYSGTPTAGTLLDADEVLSRATGVYQVSNDPAAAVWGSYIDVTGVTGDVETRPKILMSSGGANMAPVLAVRRHGIISDVSLLVQAESATQGTDTTTGADAAMSGGNRSRCSFATVAAMATRLTVTLPFNGGFARTAARGVYRLWAAIASSNNTSVYAIRQRIVSGFGGSIPMLTGPTVTYTPTVANDRYLADLDLFGVPVGPDPGYDGYGGEALVGSVDVQIQVQRVSGAGSLDLDFIAALPADEETCRLATTYLDIVLDGPTNTVYTPDGIGAVTAAAVPAIARDGDIPRLTPNQTNRIYILRPDGLGTGFVCGPDVKSRTAAVTVTWNPCYLTWAP